MAAPAPGHTTICAQGKQYNSGVDYSPSSSLQSDLAPSDLTSFDFLKDAVRGHRFEDDEELRPSGKELQHTAYDAKGEKNVLIVKETWWKNDLVIV
jgi:hypothetical protein